jgi:hypothetical protein
LAALAAIFLCAPPASAQLSRVGTNPNLGAAPVRGTDTAFDPINNVYLVVGSTAGNTINPLFGVFANTSGVPVTAPFQVNNGGQHAHFPRAVYSPHVSNGAGGFGGFLVTWHGGLFTNSVRARVVAYPNRVVSAEFEIPSSTFQEAGPSVAYSTISQVFLVTWQASDFSVWAARIGTSGQPAGGPFQVSQPGVGSRDPSVAWNSHTNEFGIVYTGFSPSGATTTFARVNTGGTVLRRNTFNFAAGTYITDLAFNSATGRFVAAWFQGGTFGAEIDANGDAIAQGLLSTTTGTRDGLGLSYNRISGTLLLVGMGPSFNVWAAELNSRGARTSADVEITSAGGPLGSYHPRAATNTSSPTWNVSFQENFGTMRDQVVHTSSTGGGPGGSLGAVAPPPSGGGGCPGTAPFPGAVCVNGGWVPGSSGGGSTGGCPGTAPFPGAVCVNGGWIPGTPGGGSTGGCPGTAPFPGAVCVNGGWIPGTSGGGSTGGCTTPDPFTAIGGGTCINGGWVPGGSGGGSTGGCPGTAPFPGAVCINGGWVPGSGSGSGSAGCTTGSPGSGWTCVNGGWLPPGSGSTSSCSTPDPFAAIGGGTCSNGGWTFGAPVSGGCTTPDPFTAMGGGVCINGGWVPRSS